MCRGCLSVSAVNDFVFVYRFATVLLLCSFLVKTFFVYFELNMCVYYLVAQDILTFEFCFIQLCLTFLSTRNKRYSSTRFDFLSAVCTCVSEFVLAYLSS